MKHFALVITFALLATMPASAAEIFEAAPVMTPAPAMTPVNQNQEVIALVVGFPQLIPRCYELAGDSCSSTGTTRACTDACGNDLSCTCRNFYGGTYGTTFLGRYWVCQHEC